MPMFPRKIRLPAGKRFLGCASPRVNPFRSAPFPFPPHVPVPPSGAHPPLPQHVEESQIIGMAIA